MSHLDAFTSELTNKIIGVLILVVMDVALGHLIVFFLNFAQVS